jgi:hypothetical protein
LALFERHGGVGAFDAVLAATAMAHRADALVSADLAFGAITGLHHRVPDAPGVASLLAD